VKAQRVLEINADHPAYAALKEAVFSDQEKAKAMAEIMYGQAVLIAGVPMDDVSAYSDSVFKLF
jgi:molecular chaperone HtpG